MVSIVTKRIHGNEYLYLVTSIRKKEKVIQKTIKYIGKKRPIRKEEFECMEYSYKREDWILDECRDQLSYQDHESIRKSSREYQKYLGALDKISRKKEKERFLSIFISNSNAIEGSTVTVKETYDYLFKSVVPKDHTKKELFMASNLLDAWEYLEKNYGHLPTEKDMKELQKRVNKGIEEEKTLGEYKTVQNYIGDIYTSSYLFVPERMQELLVWMHTAFQKIDDFEVAAQSHAQFEIIHPFIDGNGRVGRLLLNWLLLYRGYSPLAIHEKKRARYITALDSARRKALKPICQFCFEEYAEQYKTM